LTYTTGVESNDVPFKNSFPYVALPHAGDSDCGGSLANVSERQVFDGGMIGINTDIISPESNILATNYPNPFTDATTIRYRVEKESMVQIAVFDHSGRLISTLVNETLAAGDYETRFESAGLPAGLYLARIVSGSDGKPQVLKLLKR
ncbi:MAG: T9SS type A sorting domain-containing protein, partial [Saprospiraceae bacterium]|nr:T9SS type A sorting domain-containing protein [Saprospiraceae bacterium]